MRTRQTRLPDIPEEIIPEMIAYLPLKSLCRFRCVSKPWQSLIQDPSFVIKHTDKAQEKEEVGSQRSRLMFADKKHRSFHYFPINEYYLGRQVEFEKLDFQHGEDSLLVSGVLNYKFQSCWDGILLNGGLHWFAGNLEDEENDPCVIICFDLETDVVREISVSSDHFFEAESYHVALYQEQLCITHRDLRNDDYEFWVMREYEVQDSWNKIIISDVLRGRNYVPTCYQDKQTGDDLWICDGKFVTCNLGDDDEVNIISRFPWISSRRHVCGQVGFYMESLYSLDYVHMIEIEE